VEASPIRDHDASFFLFPCSSTSCRSGVQIGTAGAFACRSLNLFALFRVRGRLTWLMDETTPLVFFGIQLSLVLFFSLLLIPPNTLIDFPPPNSLSCCRMGRLPAPSLFESDLLSFCHNICLLNWYKKIGSSLSLFSSYLSPFQDPNPSFFPLIVLNVMYLRRIFASNRDCSMERHSYRSTEVGGALSARFYNPLFGPPPQETFFSFFSP